MNENKPNPVWEGYTGDLVAVFHDLLLRDLLVDFVETKFGGALPNKEIERIVDAYLEEHKEDVIELRGVDND